MKANVQSANLRMAILYHAMLDDADFRDARLHSAVLIGARGTGVNFSKADLSDVYAPKLSLPRARFVITSYSIHYTKLYDKTFEEAIRKAFQAVSIELRKFREKRAKKVVRTGAVPPLRGVVCKLFPKQEYGFILSYNFV